MCIERSGHLKEEYYELKELQYRESYGEKSRIKESALTANIWRDITKSIGYLAFIIGVSFLILTYVGQRTEVFGSSMEKSLHDGDNLIVDKLSYKFSKPERFDIVVLRQDEMGTEKLYIKRIIGLPGETVQIVGSKIYINKEILDESYGLEPIKNGGRAVVPITLGDDEYFVLGDNRNDSTDSRDPSVGNVSIDRIVGKAFVRIWPANSVMLLK